METFPLHKKVKHYKTTQKPSTLEENKKQQLPKQTEPHVQVPTWKFQTIIVIKKKKANRNGKKNIEDWYCIEEKSWTNRSNKET